MTISPSILAMPSPALRICSHQIRPWARQVEAKVPGPPRPRHARATGVQGRAIADRHARIQQPNGKPVADARWELRLVTDQLPVARGPRRCSGGAAVRDTPAARYDRCHVCWRHGGRDGLCYDARVTLAYPVCWDEDGCNAKAGARELVMLATSSGQWMITRAAAARDALQRWLADQRSPAGEWS